MATAVIKIQVRRDTEANWLLSNPVLLSGEHGFITDIQAFIIGNGVDSFTTLYGDAHNIYPSQFYTSAFTTNSIYAQSLIRIAAEQQLQTNIDTEEDNRTLADSILQASINNEASTRDSADIVLQANIDSEAATRGGADSILNDAIVQEGVDRTNADNNLQTNIDLKQDEIIPATVADYFRGDKTFQTLNKSAVGLGNVDNTSDINKPVSTAQQTAINKVRDFLYYRRPNSWHTPSISPTHQTVAVSANTMFFIPFVVIDTLTITDIGYNVTLVGTTTLARCGIYSSNASNEPSVLLADSGNLGVTLGSKSVTLGTPLVLTAGLYWTAYVQNGTGSVTGCTNLAIPNVFGNSIITGTGINAYSKVVTYGALPNPVTALTNSSGAIPFAYFKIT